jgi:molecular chaperone DnaK
LTDPIVGIDLGTSNSVVAHADQAGAVKSLPDDGGYKIHPSVVSFHPNGGVVIGAAAKQRKVIDPQNTIYSVKRLIGRSYRSPEVQTAMARVPYQIKEGANQLPMIVTRGGEFAVPEVSAIVLDHMGNIATSRLGQKVTRAVVTVPASFNDAQRSATATAGAIAGLTVVRVLNEPTAAALAYGHTRNLRETIAVYDFGGGTFDITILKLDDQVYEVLGTSGDTFLGGDDLDERLVDKMVAKFLAEHRIDLRTNEVSMMRLRAVAEQTKIELSRRSRAVVRVDEIAYGAKGVPLNLHIEITRDEFVSQVADIIDRTFPVCQEALTLAGLDITAISDVILVGGTTKIPYVRDEVGKFFAKPARTDVNPEDAVAVGAALQARSLERILSRPRASSRQVPIQIPVQVPPEADTEDSMTGSYTDIVDPENEISGSVTMAPIDELTTGAPRRPTAAYDLPPRAAAPTRPPESRPDTSYSVTRGGLRDHFDTRAPPLDDKTQPSGLNPLTDTATATEPFESTTPPPKTVPLARITRSNVVAPPPLPAKTLFGVPPGPESSGPPPVPKAATSRGLPAQARPPAQVLELPPTLELDATRVSNELELASPAATLPLSPVAPIAPPTARTLVALAPDFAAEVDTANAAATARGLGAARQPPRAHTPRPDDFDDSIRPLGDLFESPPSYPIPAAAVAAPPSPVLLEVTPRGLGIATVAGYCEELIRRNSRVPAETKKLFTTSRDRQAVVRIVVCQGESRRLDSNVVIGDLVLQGLPPRPRGETSIEVTFMLDASGILQVSARDSQTGTEQHASLDLVGGVPTQDVAASRERLQQLRR